MLALNESLSGSDARVGLVPFGDTAAAADVGAARGIQLLVGVDEDADRDGQGIPDIETVARSMQQTKVEKFEPYDVGSGTDFESPLASSADVFDADGGASERVVHFLTDGASQIDADTSQGLRRLQDLGAVVHTYAIGGEAEPCDRDGKLTERRSSGSTPTPTQPRPSGSCATCSA